MSRPIVCPACYGFGDIGEMVTSGEVDIYKCPLCWGKKNVSNECAAAFLLVYDGTNPIAAVEQIKKSAPDLIERSLSRRIWHTWEHIQYPAPVAKID